MDNVQPLSKLREPELAFQASVRRFAESTLRPRVSAMDRAERLDPEILAQLFRHGLMGIEVPPGYGGEGGTHFNTVLAIEELARVDPGVAVVVDVHNVLVNGVLLRHGSSEQKERYLPRLARSVVGAFALSEKESGSDAFAMKASAHRVGEGFVISGHKSWVTNGAEASVFIVWANASPAAGNRSGVSAFIVDRDAAGLTLGAPAEKLGIRASSTCELILNEVHVPDSSLIGSIGGGYPIAIDLLSLGRVGIAAQMLGLSQGAFEAARVYAKQRRQFGAPIGSYQGVQFPIAEMSTEIHAARLMVYNLARLLESGAAPGSLTRLAAEAKYFASQVAQKTAQQAVQIHGGNGYTREFPVEKFYRDAIIGSIYEGTSNVLLRSIAVELLGALK